MSNAGGAHEPLVATALAFAKHGHAVFPLHYPVGADKLVCSCGRLCGKTLPSILTPS